MEFQSREVEESFDRPLKDGTKRVGVGEYETFVHVLDATEFREFVSWKYDDTTSKWVS